MAVVRCLGVSYSSHHPVPAVYTGEITVQMLRCCVLVRATVAPELLNAVSLHG